MRFFSLHYELIPNDYFKQFLDDNIKRFSLKYKEMQLHNTPFEEYSIEINSVFVESFVECKQ
jgi:hypothetical protein